MKFKIFKACLSKEQEMPSSLQSPVGAFPVSLLLLLHISVFLCSNSSSLKLAFLSFFFSSISMAVSFDALFLILTGFAFEAGERKSCLNKLNHQYSKMQSLLKQEVCANTKSLNIAPLAFNHVILFISILKTTIL